MLRLAPICCLLLALGCGEDDARPGTVGVEIALGSDGLRILEIGPPSRMPGRSDSTGGRLRYQLVDDDGAIIAGGVIPDFRIVHADGYAADGSVDLPLRDGVGGLRLPERDGELTIGELGGPLLGRARFAPTAPTARRSLATTADVRGEPVRILGDGVKASAAVDVLFLPEGYREDELAKFASDAQAIADGVRSLGAWASYEDRLTFWRQDVVSRESGVDVPGEPPVDTAFQMGLTEPGVAGIIRPSEDDPGGNELAMSLGRAADADVIVLVVNHEGRSNTSYPGGGPVRGVVRLSVADARPMVLSHELGHIITGLADEYVEDGSCNIERGRPNVAPMYNDDVPPVAILPPWAGLIPSGTPIPTPPGTAGVGVFVGGNYCATGMYRAEDHCLMACDADQFCAICRQAIGQFFGVLSDRGQALAADECPAEWRDDGICDLCLDDDGDDCCPTAWSGDGVCDECLGDDVDCDGIHCDDDGTCDSLVESCSTCPGDCGSCDLCGDGHCAGDETVETCAEDCGCSVNGGAWCGTVAPYGCYCDDADTCAISGDCCADADVCW
jgi:hypothetical protein